jgi:hypothetical protein
MAYKTILVHCNDKMRVGRTVGVAVELAKSLAREAASRRGKGSMTRRSQE